MEINDYLRVIRKRLAVLILIPILAAAAAAAVVLTRPEAYSATATVASGTLVGGPESLFSGTQGTAQYIAAFTETSLGPVVAQDVRNETGVGRTQLNDGLAVRQVGASADVSVTYTSKDRALAPEVAKAVVSATLTRMFKPRADLANSESALAQDAADQARTARDDYVAKVKIADPERAYDATLSSISQLEQQQAYMRSVGNAAGASAMQSSIDSRRSSLTTFLPIITQYNALTAAVDSAEASLSSSTLASRQASVQLSAATSPDTTFIGASHPRDRTAELLALVLPVFGAAVLLSIVAVFVVEMLSPKRRRAREAAAGVPETATARGAVLTSQDEVVAEAAAPSEPEAEPEAKPVDVAEDDEDADRSKDEGRANGRTPVRVPR